MRPRWWYLCNECLFFFNNLGSLEDHLVPPGFQKGSVDLMAAIIFWCVWFWILRHPQAMWVLTISSISICDIFAYTTYWHWIDVEIFWSWCTLHPTELCFVVRHCSDSWHWLWSSFRLQNECRASKVCGSLFCVFRLVCTECAVTSLCALPSTRRKSASRSSHTVARKTWMDG